MCVVCCGANRLMSAVKTNKMAARETSRHFIVCGQSDPSNQLARHNLVKDRELSAPQQLVLCQRHSRDCSTASLSSLLVNITAFTQLILPKQRNNLSNNVGTKNNIFVSRHLRHNVKNSERFVFTASSPQTADKQCHRRSAA